MRWIPFRPDEADAIYQRLRQLRPDLIEQHWETRAAQLETVVALAAWRAQPLDQRIYALIDALDASRDVQGPRWGRFARHGEEVDRS